MIQRIQTIYLLASLLLIALSGIFPFASINVQEQIIDFKLFQFLTETEGDIALNQPVWGGLFFWLQNIIFALFIIFAYNNRPKQAKLCKILCLTELIYLITMGTYAIVLSSKINGNIAPTFATCLPLLAIVFAIFAKRAIIRDERLVRSSERLR